MYYILCSIHYWILFNDCLCSPLTLNQQKSSNLHIVKRNKNRLISNFRFSFVKIVYFFCCCSNFASFVFHWKFASYSNANIHLAFHHFFRSRFFLSFLFIGWRCQLGISGRERERDFVDICSCLFRRRVVSYNLY